MLKSDNRNLEDRYYEYKEFVSCAIKLRHTSYWTALHHIASLRKNMPLAHLQIYECLYCDGLHVTTGRTHKDREGLIKSLKSLEEKIAVPGYQRRAPKSIKEHHAKLVLDLKSRIAELN